jgi:hypothetical protein
MKTVRNLTIMVGLSAALLALGTIGARGQIAYPARFAGTLTLPFEAHWGAMTLAAGDYTLQYGIQDDGSRLAYVRSTAKGGPYGMILAGPLGQTSATKNALVCVREGNVLIVRALEMPAIGEAVRFPLPRGVELVAQQRNHNANTQLTETRIPMIRVPVSR